MNYRTGMMQKGRRGERHDHRGHHRHLGENDEKDEEAICRRQKEDRRSCFESFCP